MPIKDRFNTRLKRIQEYKQRVSFCDDVRHNVMEYEKNITAYIGPTDNDRRMVCIKTYYTFVNSINMVPSDDVHIITRYCPCFNDERCTMYGCPYHYRNMKYKEMQSLLQKARIDKKASFKRIFGRIK